MHLQKEGRSQGFSLRGESSTPEAKELVEKCSKPDEVIVVENIEVDADLFDESAKECVTGEQDVVMVDPDDGEGEMEIAETQEQRDFRMRGNCHPRLRQIREACRSSHYHSAKWVCSGSLTSLNILLRRKVRDW